MSKQRVFLLGATGETGKSILEALIADGSFDIVCFIRAASANKPAAQKLRDRCVEIVTGELSDPVEKLTPLLKGVDTVISAIFAHSMLDQIPLIDAAKQAGVKRFVPCWFGAPVARGGIMTLQDIAEEVNDHLFRLRLGYTIIVVGYWYIASVPRVPSGKFDYAAFPNTNEVFVGGKTPNMLIDKTDIGRITARIIKDERTLNKRVYAYGEVLSQNEIYAIVEKKTGEKLELTQKSAEDIRTSLEAAEKARKSGAHSDNIYEYDLPQFANSMYLREDNTPENAEYLGNISARELYPDFQYTKYAKFVDDLIAGKVNRPYA